MFEPVPGNLDFPAEEQRILALWKQHDVFRRSIEECRGRPRFNFYEGPPTANGKPHPGNLYTRVIKDVYLRYHTMRGYEVPRRGGWDTHGLPVEIEVEKELGIHGKQEIERYGIEAYTRKCLESVFRYIDEWRRMTERIAFWLDLDDAYATFHESYVQSVWWALATFFEKGLLYQDYKVVWWWPQGNTALSAGEVGQGYKQVDDPAVTVRFPVAGREGVSILSWTTTPWTLPSNAALAVAPGETYVEARTADGETVILAEARSRDVLGDSFEVLRRFEGRELAGTRYEPLYRYRAPEGGKAHEVVAASFVTLDTGTGVVHIAPGFGEDDFKTARECGVGFLQLLEPDGTFPADAGPLAGLYFKAADKEILRDLRRRKLLFKEETYRHDYPFCWRAMDDPLVQYARRSWFVRTTAHVPDVVANNAKIRWQPEHIRDGRMGDFLRNNVDWALSRERWWGTPLPIWVNDATGRMEAVSSVAEILEKNPRAFDAFDAARAKDPSMSPHLRVHKPWIDEVTWTREGEPGTYRRVPEVIDCWFDAGSMPFAQWGYPHANRDEFERSYPADFITEGVDQTRGWWNALLQVNTLLFPDREPPHPFKSCVVLGHITDRHGQKMSKSKRNYTDPMEMIDSFGADAVRWHLIANNVPGQNTRFFTDAAKEAVRELLLKLHNVHSFLVTYARIDGWDPRSPAPADRGVLDRWVLAELDATTRDVHDAFGRLECHAAARRIQAFVDGLSNWYLRRSRARFWAEGKSADKAAAYATLYECLSGLSVLLAPFAPFFAERLHQHLVRPFREDAPVSVHLAQLPEGDDARRDDALRRVMGLVRDAVALGQRVRAEHQLKVRQPLPEAILVHAGGEELEPYLDAVREELNVKRVSLSTDPARYVAFEVLPNFRALGPRLGKRLPELKRALSQADGAELHARLEREGFVEVAGERLTRDEVEVRVKEREGYAAAGEGALVVVLDTKVTADLRREGLAREAIHRLQQARKERDLPYEARIAVVWRAEGELAAALAEHAAWISGETLAREFAEGDPGAAAPQDVEGFSFAFSIRPME